MITITGYIISYRGWNEQTQLDMGMSSFAWSAAEAWRRHIGYDKARTLDFPILVQRWSDKGFGPIRVNASIAPKEEPSS